MDRDIYTFLTTKEEAIEALRSGKVGIIPTDTVYGIVARAHDRTAVARLYRLKDRDRKPGTIVAANINQLRNIGLHDKHLARSNEWWPNPLSVVLPLSQDFDYLQLGVGDIAIRVVNDPIFSEFLEKTGPLLTSSANLPGEPTALTIQDGWDYFKENVDFYVDGGNLTGRAPSTVIRISDDGSVMLLRQGALKLPADF